MLLYSNIPRILPVTTDSDDDYGTASGSAYGYGYSYYGEEELCELETVKIGGL